MHSRTSFSSGHSSFACAILFCLGFFALLVCSCTSDRPDDPAAPQIRLKSYLKADLYGLVQLTVTGHDFRRIQTEMRQEQDVLVADITVPPGVDRHFLIEIFSAGGALLYRGETIVDVLPEPVLDLDLEVKPVATLMAISPHLVPVTMDNSFTVTVGIHGLPNVKRILFSANIVRSEVEEWDFPFPSGYVQRPPGLNPAFFWRQVEGSIEVDCVEYIEPVDIYGDDDFAPLAVMLFNTFDNWGPDGQEYTMEISLEAVEDFDGNSYTSESIYLDQAVITLLVPPVRDTVSQYPDDQRGYAITSNPYGGFMIAGSNVLPESPVDPYLARTTAYGGVYDGYTWNLYRGEAVGVVSAGEGNYLVALNAGVEGQQGYVTMVTSTGSRIWEDPLPWESRCNAVTAHGPDQFAMVGYDIPLFAGKERSPRPIIGIYNQVDIVDLLYLDNKTGTYDGGFEGNAIVSLGAQGFAVAGTADELGTNGTDLYLAQVSVGGLINWETLFGGTGQDVGRGLVQTLDGGLVTVGSTTTYGSGLQDVLLVKTDSSGQVLWYRTFGGSDQDVGHAIALLSGGGFLIVGETRSFSDGDLDAYVIKTSSSGAFVWKKTMGGFLDDSARGLTPIGPDEFAVVGYTTSSKYGEEIITWKIDASAAP